MKLFWSSRSPFVRKVMVAAYETGLADRIERMRAVVAPAKPNAEVMAVNPLNKLPTLLTEDGQTLYDSRVICEYLDGLRNGPKLFPAVGPERLAALRRQALGDGIMDASILIVYEGRYRPAEKHEQKWLDLQAGKIERALAALEAAPPALDTPPNIGQITLACALGYREFRFPGALTKNYPRLTQWLDTFAQRVPAFEATKPPAV